MCRPIAPSVRPAGSRTVPTTGSSNAHLIVGIKQNVNIRIDNAYTLQYNQGRRMVTIMPGDANWSTRLDSTLKVQAEEILSDVGLTMSGVFTMLLKQIVREKSVPLSLSLDSSNAVYADLLEAQTERLNGYQGRNARDVLRDMEQAIAEVEARG